MAWSLSSDEMAQLCSPSSTNPDQIVAARRCLQASIAITTLCALSHLMAGVQVTAPSADPRAEDLAVNLHVVSGNPRAVRARAPAAQRLGFPLIQPPMDNPATKAAMPNAVEGGFSARFPAFVPMFGGVLKVVAVGWIVAITRATALVLQQRRSRMAETVMLSAAGEQNSSADARLTAAMSRVGSYDAQAIRDKLDEIVYKSPVALFFQSGCTASANARDFLRKQRLHFRCVEVDRVLHGDAMRLELALRTGIGALPLVFIGGTCVGGHADLLRLHLDGKLQALLTAANATYLPSGERKEAEAPPTEDPAASMDVLKRRIEATQMAELKARIAQNMAPAEDEEEIVIVVRERQPQPQPPPNPYAKPEAISPTPIPEVGAASRATSKRLDAISAIKQEETNLLATWTSDVFYVVGGLGAVGALLLFVTQAP
eukprot:EG_transcript_9108